MSPTSVFTYKKLNNTFRDVVVDPSKTEEFTPRSSYVFTTSDDGEFFILTPPEIHTHLRVWDVENEGWRTLIKSNIKSVTHSEPVLNRTHAVDTRPISRQNGVDCRKNELCWHYYKMASDNYRWYYDFRNECIRVFEDSDSGHLIDYLDRLFLYLRA